MKNALAACLAGLFAFWIALSSFLLLLKVTIHLLSDIFDLLFSILISVHGEAGPEVLLPEHTSFISWLPCVPVVFLRPTDFVVFTPMACTIGHLAAEGLSAS